MTLKQILLPCLFALVAVGCDSNPTNAPTQAEIDQAKADQIKAIDNDPSMSAEDKQRLKQAKGFLPGGTPAAQSTGGDAAADAQKASAQGRG